MAWNKRAAVVFAFGICLIQGLFAQPNVMKPYFVGDDLNQSIRSYIVNVSNLIPDSATLQNVWARPPRPTGFFGFGVNGSVTFLERKLIANAVNNSGSFGGKHNDLSQFPTTIPYLPGTAIDLRGGTKNFDLGISGMWMDDNLLSNALGTPFLGDSSHFTYRMLGLDMRYAVLGDKKGTPIPSVTVQAGYYFTWLGFGIDAGSEKVDVQFRNDTYLLAVEASKDLFIVKPYLGAKLLLSKTDSGFSWDTDRQVTLKGVEYPFGVSYNSGGNAGDLKAYFQIYGGVGLTIIFPYLITLGGAYNVVTNHFGINLAVRLVIG